MTPEQREELKQAAQKATPGKWQANRAVVYLPENSGGFELRRAPNGEANADYIALANPVAILSLIAQVEALNRKNLELQRVYDERGQQIGRLEAALQRAKVEALTYTVDGIVMSPLEYIDYMHGQYAGERLRADQGWERYESANRDRNALRAAMVAPTIPAIPGTKDKQ